MTDKSSDSPVQNSLHAFSEPGDSGSDSYLDNTNFYDKAEMDRITEGANGYTSENGIK
jgi:hypothetical protein